MSKVHWYGLSRLPGIGGATLSKLLDRFGNAESVFAATDNQLLQVRRVTERTVAALRALSLEAIEEELASLAADGIGILTWKDTAYPSQLLQIGSPPPILYIRGRLEAQDRNSVAIVGTRSPRSGSARLAQVLASQLAKAGITVVSGLAKGVDTSAHTGALETPAGRTIAVLGSGLNAIHPRENERLAMRIAQQGALLSEVGPDVRARGTQLMARDRIISGLSRAVVVVEANLESGSLDTARKAQKQRRLLYAFPGSPGTDNLLEEGARQLKPNQIDYEDLIHAIQRPLHRQRSDDETARQLSLDL